MSSISVSEVEKVIARAVAADAIVTDYSLAEFSSDKCGLMGSHFLLTVKVGNSKHNELESAHTFFVKALPASLPNFMDESSFIEEINFYEKIQALMLADCVGIKWSPDCYLARKNMIILEDLRAQGFSVHVEETMNERLLKSALVTLARFHASSILAEARLKKSFKEVFPNSFTEKVFSEHSNFGKTTKVCFETIILMAKQLDLDSTLVFPHINKYVSDSVKAHEGELNVVSHGDLYRNNVMFDVKCNAIIVDYQFLRYASPAIDISMLVHLNTTAKLRKELGDNIVKHYYSIFKETLEKSMVNIDIPPYKYITEMYEKYKIVGMAAAAMYLPALYLEAEHSAKLINDSKALEEFMLRNRFEIIGPKLASDSVYAKKMKDVLIEFLNEGKRVLTSAV